MPDEVGILRELGFSVFTPRVLPKGLEGRSTAVEPHSDRAALDLPPETLAVLERHPFYERRWTPTLANILNEHFETVVTAFYPACFTSAIRQFGGRVVARAFGREGDATYGQLIAAWGDRALNAEVAALGERYVFGQGYPFLAEVEAARHAERAVTLPIPSPGWIAPSRGRWSGGSKTLLFLCPLVGVSPYYDGIYRTIKRVFGDLSHQIFGHQPATVPDPNVIVAPGDAALLDLYAGTPCFVYPSAEARHLHYTPIEAMIVGAPVLYLRGALLDRMVGEPLPGACAGLDEMRVKAVALLNGDTALSDAVRATQAIILARVSRDVARDAWGRLLGGGESA